MYFFFFCSCARKLQVVSIEAYYFIDPLFLSKFPIVGTYLYLNLRFHTKQNVPNDIYRYTCHNKMGTYLCKVFADDDGVDTAGPEVGEEKAEQNDEPG